MGEGIVPVGVAAVLRQDHIGAEPAGRFRHDAAKGVQPGFVFGEGVQGKIDAGSESRPLTPFVNGTGAGKQVFARFVDGDGHDLRVVVKGPLHPVSVVGVGVDVQNPGVVLLPQPGDGHRRIVVDAKTGGAPPEGVMKPAREVEGVFALPRHHLFGGDEGYSFFGRMFGHRPSVTLRFEVQRQENAEPHPVFGETEHAVYELDGLTNPYGAELHGQSSEDGGEILHLSMRFLR